MADEFKGFSNESLKNVQGVRDTMRDPEMAHISKRMFCWPIALCTHVVQSNAFSAGPE
jgi:hypothetical protein